ncbi:MAG: acyl-CoA dehydrogenase family protein [Thermoplasmata archaeon]
MMDEEHKVLESVVGEFAVKEIQPINKQIELEGIGRDLKNKLSSQGFLGALAPYEYGGASLDRLGYSILLKQLASESPSVAFYIFLQNSFVIKSLLKNEKVKEKVKDVSTGNISGTFYYSNILNFLESGKLSVENGFLSGKLNAVINSDANIFIVPYNNKFYYIEEGHKALEEHEKLGFKGLKFSPVSFNVKMDNVIEIDINLKEILDDIHLPISAIAIGIAQGALTKAIAYSKERSAFLHKLKDFQPLAFGMAQAYSQLDILNEYLISISQGEKDIKKELMLKIVALDFARDVSKLALQIHGGYGYLMDFGIEKYYRDAMFLSVLGGNHIEERKELSSLIFEERAGWI